MATKSGILTFTRRRTCQSIAGKSEKSLYQVREVCSTIYIVSCLKGNLNRPSHKEQRTSPWHIGFAICRLNSLICQLLFGFRFCLSSIATSAWSVSLLRNLGLYSLKQARLLMPKVYLRSMECIAVTQCGNLKCLTDSVSK